MGMLERIKETSFKCVDSKMNELKEQFMEMGQLKSEFDIEKFTVKKEGNFLAHNFHFLMRQYSLALQELCRMLLDKEELTRQLKEYQEMLDKGIKTVDEDSEYGRVKRYVDIEIHRRENKINALDISLVNKACMIDYFEICRLKLIELNGGSPPTNAQYQREEPEYWRWFLLKKALNQHKQTQSGISEGVWESIDFLEELPVLNNDYQVEIGSKFEIEKIDKEIAEHKKIANRHCNELEDRT